MTSGGARHIRCTELKLLRKNLSSVAAGFQLSTVYLVPR